MTARWRVERHGGRQTDRWRVVFEGSEDGARRKFLIVFFAMRQGGLRLINPAGEVVRTYGSPLLRSRW